MIKVFRLLVGFLLSFSWVAFASELKFDVDNIKSSHLKEAFRFAKHFEDFEVANYEKTNSSHNGKDFIDLRPQNYLENSKLAQLLQKLIYQCDQGKLTQINLLSYMLDMRFSFLDNRRNTIIKSKNTLEDFDLLKNNNAHNFILYGPTHPKFFNDLPENAKYYARTSTDRYQFLNQLILYTWTMVDPRKLPADVKLKIRCSTMLWKNLTGESADLGHPDEAILIYEEDPQGLIKDWDLNDLHLRKREMSMDLLNWTKKETTIFASPYEIENGKIAEAPYPEWLKPLPQFTHLQQNSFSVVEEDIELKKQPLIKKPNKKKKLKQVQKSKPILPSLPLIETIEEVKEESDDVQINVNFLIKKDSNQNNKSIGDKILPSISTSVKNKLFSQKLEVCQPLTSLKSYNEASLRPRGMRVFHKEQPKTQQSILKLSGNHAKTLTEIFDAQQFKKVNYAQIKSLWKYINGQGSVDEKTGSSHKKFISLNGQVFSGFAHGDGMTYTQNTIRYVRDMFRQIGYSDDNV